ncbi:MAG TPA: CAP domain-containing protein [Candidatus Anaerotruncus excrementipullorum]|uniref:CAP domain-containing protein n=1 Tax=Candidatus Anaerotruncus excrementipullorum TaxID=2838465 RepID=A0A9D2B7D7_9FIRM|nr:CAP domain-containing protein [Candidatus Anaerotruncus excrementipullorum]
MSAPEEASSAASSEAASAAAASEAAAQEAAAQQAAQEAAAQQAAQEAAAQQAAQEAAAQQAAQEAAAQQAAQEAAAQQAAQEAAAQEKPKNKVTISGSNFLSRVEDQLLDLHNEARAQQGLGSLTVNEDLHTAARIRAKELYQQYQRNGKEIAHERPNGDTWSTVLQEDVPMEYSAAGENLCSVVYQKEYIDQKGEDPGRDADWWMEQWLGSPTHREVLMNGRYSQVGFGVYYIKRDGMVYAFATALFIDP